MRPEKISNNVEFDVIYDDGSRKHVPEGLLFEPARDNDEIIMHIGTGRTALLFAVAEALLLTFEKAGLTEKFEEYLRMQLDDGEAQDDEF